MKIGITCYPTYGGSGIVATELGKELAERGHEIHFISYALPMRLNRATPNIFFHEVEVTNYPLFDHPPYTLALASKMAEVASLQGLDLLHCHYAIPHATSAWIAKEMLQREFGRRADEMWDRIKKSDNPGTVKQLADAIKKLQASRQRTIARSHAKKALALDVLTANTDTERDDCFR